MHQNRGRFSAGNQLRDGSADCGKLCRLQLADLIRDQAAMRGE